MFKDWGTVAARGSRGAMMASRPCPDLLPCCASAEWSTRADISRPMHRSGRAHCQVEKGSMTVFTGGDADACSPQSHVETGLLLRPRGGCVHVRILPGVVGVGQGFLSCHDTGRHTFDVFW